ncbi:MAG: hypothetical protein AB7E46_06625 [Desulfovibrio sp.]|jgi:hypothetical protein
MLGEADGYYHLWRSQVLLEGKAAWLGEPALSVLGAAVQSISGVPMEMVAYWLPSLLALATGLWIWKWGRLLGAGQACCALAAFVGGLVPAWFTRACPGWYDTDPGVAFLWHGSLFATACLSLAPGRPALRHALLLTACCLLLGWWWKPGFAMLPLCLALWGGTFFFARELAWRRARLVTGIAVLAGAAFFLALPAALLPQPLAVLRNYAISHAAMAVGRVSDATLLSIDELSPLTVSGILSELGGNAASGLLALAVTGLLFLRAPRACIFLLPSFATVALALFAQRFLYLAALPLALGVGLLPWLLDDLRQSPRVAGKAPSRRVLGALAWSICLAIVLSLAHGLSRTPLNFPFQEPQDRIARMLKRVAPPGAKLWNWWDDGYFLAARSGLAPLFHGGSQTGRMAFIAAHPLVSDDPLFARRWIRFFAARGDSALIPLRAALGSEEAAWATLEEVLAAPDVATALAQHPPIEGGAAWFEPQDRVFLYLPQRFLRLSKWWVGLGRSRTHDVGAFKAHIDTFRRTEFGFNTAQNQVILPQEALAKGYTDFGGVFVTNRTPLVPPFGGGVPGPYVVTSELSPWLYIVDETAIASVGFRLLAPGGVDLPGFAPVVVNYAYGGLWEVLP